MPEVDAILKFAPYDPLLEVQGGIDPEQYQQVFDGNLATEDLDEIWNILNSDLKPQGYTGHSLSISDLIEIYDGEQSRFHYVDRFGFVEPQLAFENTQTISL